MTNRLADATSPYLLQHKDNPVDWFEWSDEAFAEARERNVPVLLSVGYAACHWCHVMAHESFEDEATAAYMNEHYVNIKVDREERPDVDAVYMQATVALTGQGGWPMTCVLDHEGSPFFAGTYFPDQPRHGQPSFRQLLEAINDAWTNRSGEVAEASSRIREALARTVELSGGSAFDRATLDDAVDRLGRDFDAEFGGFGSAPKFPPSMVLEFLLRVSTSPTTSKGDEATNMVGRTLASMAAGGIHDQLAGGFARYGVDRAWVVPHFEKMLYDNGQLLSVYARWALLQRRRGRGPGRPRRRRLPARRAGHRRGRVRVRAGCGLRGRGGHLLRLDAGPAGRRARARGRRLGRRAADRHRAGHLRGRHLDAAAA